MAKLRITLIKSTIGRKPDHRATAEALGLKKIGHAVEKEDSPQIRGMVDKIKYMVKVEEI